MTRTRHDRVMLARRKLLSILPRSVLEELSHMERPWHAKTQDLVTTACHNWDSDEVYMRIRSIMDEARQELEK